MHRNLMFFTCIVLGANVGTIRVPAQDSAPADMLLGHAELYDKAIQSLPLTPRTEAADRRARSLAHFGTARMLERNNVGAAAIREYQLAWILNPTSKEILDQLVPLCFREQRASVGFRYGRICLLRGWKTLAPLRGVAFQSVLEEETAQTWKIYELAIRSAEQQQDHDALVGLHFDRLRMAYLNESYEVALPSAEFILDLLPHPGRYKLEERARDDLWGQPEEVYSLLGEVLFENGKMEAAEAAFRAASGGERLLNYHLGRIREQQHRHTEAVKHLTEYLSENDNVEEIGAYRLLAELHEQPTALIRNWEADLELQLRNRTLAHFLVEGYLRGQQPEKALPVCEQLAERSDDSLAQQRLLEAQSQLRQVGPLIATLGSVTIKYADLSAISNGIDQILADRKLCDSIVSEAERRMRDPRRPMLWNECFGVGLLCLAQGDLAHAKSFIRAGTRSGAKQPAMVGVLFSYGTQCLEQDQYTEASKAFADCLATDPNAEDADDIRYYLAVAQQLDKNYEESLATIDTALSGNPDSLSLALRRPSLLRTAGRILQAHDALVELISTFKATAVEDEDAEYELFDARLTLSSLCVELGNIEAAEKWLFEALGDFPLDAGAKNDLGYLWADQGKFLELAKQMIDSAVLQEPDNVAYLDSLGWVLFRLDRADEAIRPLEQATAGDEIDGILLDHLGDVYQAAGRSEDALKTWQRALAAFEKTGESSQAKAVENKLEAARSSAH